MMKRRRDDGRRLVTILFTDIAGSTERAIELGDREWRIVLRRHHQTVRGELRRFGGHEVDSAGDGFFATFPQPIDAVHCTLAIRAALRPLGLAVRSAVHTGEVEPIGQKVGGVAVHLTARVLSIANPNEVLVTSTVRELVAGSDLTFADAGEYVFKGFRDQWHVFRVTGPEPPVQPPSKIRKDAPSRRRLVIASSVVVGLAAAVIALGLAGLNQPPGVAALPNTVVRLTGDGFSGRAVPVARGPSSLAIGGGALWVASEARTLTRIDLVTHATEAIGGVGIPTAISYGGGSLWVAQGYDGRVVRVDASTLQLGDDVGLHARRLASSADALWVTDDLADRVVRISMRTLKEEGALALDVGSGPHGIAIDTHSVWVANERTATLIQIDEVSMTTMGHVIGLGSAPTQLAIGGGSLWVTSMDFDRLYRVDVEQGRVTATLDTCDGPDAVVASDQAVWVACRIGRVVRRFAIDGSATKDIELPGVPAALVLDDGGVWVAIRGD